MEIVSVIAATRPLRAVEETATETAEFAAASNPGSEEASARGRARPRPSRLG